MSGFDALVRRSGVGLTGLEPIRDVHNLRAALWYNGVLKCGGDSPDERRRSVLQGVGGGAVGWTIGDD